MLSLEVLGPLVKDDDNLKGHYLFYMASGVHI